MACTGMLRQIKNKQTLIYPLTNREEDERAKEEEKKRKKEGNRKKLFYIQVLQQNLYRI